ncbi:MAG: tol-pal system protein YbgF [Pseudomonadota bacterium]
MPFQLRLDQRVRILGPAIAVCASLCWAAPALAEDSLEQLSRDIARSGAELETLRGETLQLAQSFSASDANSIEQRFAAIEAELRRLTGQVERLGFNQRQLTERLERFQNDAEFRMTALEGGDTSALGSPSPQPSAPAANTGQTQVLGSVSAQELQQIQGLNSGTQNSGTQNSGTQNSGTQTTTTAAAGALPAGSARDQYNYAFGLVRQGDFTGAQAAMTAFIQQHPNDPLTSNAKYWLGETYYARGNYAQASQAFAQAYQDHPTGSKAPDSLLKLGLSLSLLGQSAQACQVLQEIDNRMGSTAPANILQRAQRERSNLGC